MDRPIAVDHRRAGAFVRGLGTVNVFKRSTNSSGD